MSTMGGPVPVTFMCIGGAERTLGMRSRSRAGPWQPSVAEQARAATSTAHLTLNPSPQRTRFQEVDHPRSPRPDAGFQASVKSAPRDVAGKVRGSSDGQSISSNESPSTTKKS